ISLLGAISKISNREFPFTIDTPLARLDEKHRDTVASQFIPVVSDQVIIFATNTEVTKDIRNILSSHLAREFELSYDGKSGNSEVLEVLGGGN
ncbi:MAG: DNA sulfur modification protein DndD, partial [Promethearchaeota archaeon]